MHGMPKNISKINISGDPVADWGRLERLRVLFSGVAGLAVYPPGATFGPRTLRDYEFVWIVDGQVEWEADGIVRAAPPGTLILSRPGIRELYRWDPHRPTRHAYFHFTLSRRGVQLPPETRWPLLRQMPDGDILRPLFRHVAWLLEAGRPEWQPLAEISARQLLLCFLSGAYLTRGEGGLDLSEPVLRALKFVQEHWSRGRPGQPVLEEMAQAAAVSAGHLCRLFRQEVGCGPVQATRQIRVDRAAALLSRTNLRIKAIADQLGFENPFHFSRCFKESYGVPPREFRRRAAEGLARPIARTLRVRGIPGTWWE